MRNARVVLVAVFALLFCLAAYGQTGVNNSELNGNYAFNFTGFSGNTSVSSVFAAVGRFTADGAGNLTNGELDTNTVGGGPSAQGFTGTYSIGSDHRGLMTLDIAGGSAKLAFAMLANGNAEFIEFDAAGGSGTIGSGTMEKSDTSAFTASAISGDYAFGAAGFDNTNNRAAIEGRFTSNAAGTFTNAAGDLNAYGSDYPMNSTTATYTLTDTATGRGTMHLAFTFSGTPASLNFVFYIVNSGKLFVMERDTVSTATPLLNGVVVRQHTPAGGFSDASLNGNQVIHLTGHSMCGTISGVPKAVVGLLTANGTGALSLTYDENFCRAPNSVTDAPGMYTVAANGRTPITIGGYSLVAYLVDVNQMVLFVSDANVLFGFGEPQAAASYTNSDLKGTYGGYSTNPVSLDVVTFTGEFAADGASPTGTIKGTEDISTPSGPSSGAAFDATYSVSSSPTNGRGTMTVSSGTGGTVVIYMISPSKLVGISQTDPNPAVLDFELAPSTATTVSLASLSLNPSSVTGGTQTSTGTVTLSGAAPSGGAQVSLSSNNTAAAKVPSSVTIAAGSTSATFTVTTSAVSASTAVTISAAYSGVTKSASLTVTPVPPPPPTLSSLSLSPTSVTGGTQSATGTVKLNEAAPSGGAQITLSSSDTAVAKVPASVAIAAGATSATFTVTTSIVTSSTTVNISAAYGGASKSASLTVTPVPPPPPTLSSLSLSPSSVVGGVESSTGKVTLSAPALAGGAIIALRTSNGAARVPSSVTIPAGATSASFTINTSIVLISTSSTISASYDGTTRSAALGVLL